MPFLPDIKKTLDVAKTGRTSEEKRWELSFKFLEGNQHLSYDKNIQSWLMTTNDSNLPTINLILPLYRNLVSRLQAAYPGIVVLPASPTQSDIVKAQSSEAALRYYWAEEGMEQLVTQLVEWLIPTGNALLHTYYHPSRQKVCTEVIKPYDFFYENGIVEARDSRFIAIRRFYDKGQLLDNYPDRKSEIKKYCTRVDGEAPSSSTSYVSGQAYITQDYVPPGKYEVFEVYDRKGNQGVVLGDLWLYEGKTPAGVMPCQHVKWTTIQNRVWGVGLVEPLIEMQSYYNRARGQILQNVELMANPKWLIPKSAGIAPNAISKRAGEKIFYNPAGGTPHQVAAAPIPSYVIDNVRQLQAEIQDVAGIHSSTLGKRTVGVLSGKAIETMSQQDLSSLQVTQSGIELAVKEMARCVLVMMKQFYDEPRLYRMLDTTGQIFFKNVSAENLVDVPELFIQSGSLFQDDAATRENRAVQLMQAGLLTREEALNDINHRLSNASAIERLVGLAHANDMLQAVVAGNQIEVFATDDLAAFNKVFGEFVRTPAYYGLPVETQEYIRNIIVDLAVAQMPAQQAEGTAAAMRAKMQVSPRPVAPVFEAQPVMLEEERAPEPPPPSQSMEAPATQPGDALTQNGALR